MYHKYVSTQLLLSISCQGTSYLTGWQQRDQRIFFQNSIGCLNKSINHHDSVLSIDQILKTILPWICLPSKGPHSRESELPNLLSPMAQY